MDRVDVEPELLRWARERAGLSIDALAGRFPSLHAWERREVGRIPDFPEQCSV